MQPGAWHPLSRANMAFRWAVVKSLLDRYSLRTTSCPFQIWPTSSTSHRVGSAWLGWMGPTLTASDWYGVKLQDWRAHLSSCRYIRYSIDSRQDHLGQAVS